MKLLIVCLTLFANSVYAADVWKCVDADGHLTYQGTSCPLPSQQRNISHGEISTLPLGLPDKTLEQISKARDERIRREQRDIKRRNAQLRHFINRYKARKARCTKLKSKYHQLQDQHRLGSSTQMRSYNRLIRQIHSTCST